jgi:hypothetical protein
MLLSSILIVRYSLPEAQVLIAQLQQKLQWSELQRSALEEQLRLKRIEKYGAASEKLSTYSWSCWRKNQASARRR